MLTCPIDIQSATKTDFECAPCNACKPSSALNYPFDQNLEDSHAFANVIQQFVETNTFLRCQPPEQPKYPDIRVVDVTMKDFLLCRIEAKLLTGKAFVKASEFIGLSPKETLVVDEPKLLSYIECKENDLKNLGRQVPIFVFWKFDRPCSDFGGIAVYQEIDVLHGIYKAEGDKRYFERKVVSSDYVEENKRGVTRKYHFSMKEVRPIWQFLPELFALASSHAVGKSKPNAGFRSYNVNSPAVERPVNSPQVDSPATPPQINFARVLARQNNVEFPEALAESKLQISKFIDAMKMHSKGHRI